MIVTQATMVVVVARQNQPSTSSETRAPSFKKTILILKLIQHVKLQAKKELLTLEENISLTKMSGITKML